MVYADELVKLRKRMLDALNLGVIDTNSKDIYEATLIQIMNEAERQRQTCVARAEDLRRQAAIADGQAAAFTQVGSIVYNVLNGYIIVAERQKREEQERAAEMEEKRAAMEAAAQNKSAEELENDSTIEVTNKRRKK
jgi:hypothetical protein